MGEARAKPGNQLVHNKNAQVFPIIWGHWNGIEYISSTFSCPVHPAQLTQANNDAMWHVWEA